ncbi:leucine zipper domain-containing protein [Streptomyces canus]|nr:leucine zipper domain-containing protein [Streptomyces canus]
MNAAAESRNATSRGHRNAPLTLEGRLRLCLRIDAGRPIAHVAAEAGISRRCLAKWYARWRAHRQPRQPDARSDSLVRLVHPSRGPHQVAPQRHQSRPYGGVQALQQRVPTTRVGTGSRGPLRQPRWLPKRDEWPVDVEEENGALH